jgi:transketolase N-terminal domain/subunit
MVETIEARSPGNVEWPKEGIRSLTKVAVEINQHIVAMIASARSGHLGRSLSTNSQQFTLQFRPNASFDAGVDLR